MEGLGLERAQLVRLDELRQLGCTNRAGLLSRLDDLPHVLGDEDAFDFNRHSGSSLYYQGDQEMKHDSS